MPIWPNRRIDKKQDLLPFYFYTVIISVLNTSIAYYTVSQKVTTFKLSVTLSNLNRSSNFLHCWKAYTICYKTHTTVPTSPQACRYNTLGN